MATKPVIKIERNDSDDRFREKVNNNFAILAQEDRIGVDTKTAAVTTGIITKVDDKYGPAADYVDAAQALADAIAVFEAQYAAGQITADEKAAAIKTLVAEAGTSLGVVAASLIDTAGTYTDGKRYVFWQDGPPPAEGRVEGDTWFDTNNDNKPYRWTSGAWLAQAFSSAAIGNLSAGQITTGTLNAARIAAGSIGTSKLVADHVLISDAMIGDLNAGHIKTGSIISTVMDATYIKADNIKTGTINVEVELNAATINGATINGAIVTGGVLQTALPGANRVVISGQNADETFGFGYIDFHTAHDALSHISVARPARIGAYIDTLEPGSSFGSLYISSPQYDGSPVSSIGLYTYRNDDSSMNSSEAIIQAKSVNLSLTGASSLNSVLAAYDSNGNTTLSLSAFDGGSGLWGGVKLKGLQSAPMLHVRTVDDLGYADVRARTLYGITSLRTDDLLQMKERGGTNSLRDLHLWTDGTTWQLRFYVGAALKKLTFTA